MAAVVVVVVVAAVVAAAVVVVVGVVVVVTVAVAKNGRRRRPRQSGRRSARTSRCWGAPRRWTSAFCLLFVAVLSVPLLQEGNTIAVVTMRTEVQGLRIFCAVLVGHVCTAGKCVCL
jgi:hypothetical protein